MSRTTMLLLPLFLVACVEAPFVDDDSDGVVPDRADDIYSFESRFIQDESSVKTSGQVFRHVLISDLKSHAGGLTARLDGGWFPASGDVVDELNFYFEFDSETSGTLTHGFDSDPAPAQNTYDDLSSGKDIVSKLAGNDATGQHVDWATGFAGWEQDDVTTPESLVRAWFDQLDVAAVDWSNGAYAQDPFGEPVTSVHVTAQGHDLQQLIQKFLLASVAFSQGTDDYLDNDIDQKGLLADNSAAEEGKPYSALEHSWDEGFGYFGAAYDYGLWDKADVAGDGFLDSYDQNGEIDMVREVSWGHSVNAAKRDNGSASGTDLAGEAWTAFLSGRQLIHDANGSLSPSQQDELVAFRDQAVLAWEGAIAATTVHYINEVLQDMNTFEGDDYDFGSHSKHWSELKGFALSFQFNPASPMSDSQFLDLHEKIGLAPALPLQEANIIEAYRTDLLAARTLLGDVYGFEDEDLGDSSGEHGW